MNYILGISAYFHDAAACLLKDREIIAAAQEERFTRKKHDESFPDNAINFCLQKAGIGIDDISKVVFYEKPLTKFERILKQYTSAAPFSFLPFKKSLDTWLGKKLWIPNHIRNKFGKNTIIEFAKHHESHAAAACFTSPFNEGAYIIVDGVGEWTCTSYGRFTKDKLLPDKEIEFPNSIGLLYSAFTQYCGFKVNSGEYKLMGLAPYGKPIYYDKIVEHLIQLNEDFSYKINLKYFNYHKGLTMINSKFEEIFGEKCRLPEGELTQHYKDVAASIQKFLEIYWLGLVKKVSTELNTKNICLGGGVALNCAANGVLLKELSGLNIHIHPASGDAGGALGAAILGLEEDKAVVAKVYLGPEYSNTEIEAAIQKYENIRFQRLGDEDLTRNLAQYLYENKVVGFFQGKMEWGPRALGNRSILANPIPAEMQRHVNLAIKKRESFRPFAPVVIDEFKQEYFDCHRESKEMLFTFQAKQADRIPSCVHVDGSSRVQTLKAGDHPRLHALISEFHALTSVPVLINTSFNLRGEPIVCSPADALNTFFNCDMDVLVMENYVLLKSENQNVPFEEVNYDLD